MSLSSISIIMDRIKSATGESPIAVFEPKNNQHPLDRCLVALFADTVYTRKMIVEQSDRFIGVYCNLDDLASVQNHLTLVAMRIAYSHRDNK